MKKYVKPGWKGYLAVHETISGWQCFLCKRLGTCRRNSLDRLESLQLSYPKCYKLIYKRREDAEKIMAHIAKYNRFTEVLR